MFLSEETYLETSHSDKAAPLLTPYLEISIVKRYHKICLFLNETIGRIRFSKFFQVFHAFTPFVVIFFFFRNNSHSRRVIKDRKEYKAEGKKKY